MTATSVPFSSEQKIRFGIIGCGWFGRVHVERLTDIPNCQVTALSDLDEGAMQRLVEKVPSNLLSESCEIATFTDYRDLLTSGLLDAVVIASPNKWHVEQIVAALEQNLHVLSEKPLSMSPLEVQRVCDATAKSDLLVAVAYQSRYRKDARALKSALASGKWGKVNSISVFSCEDWKTNNIGTWRHDPEKCPGGFFGDANSHQLDLIFWLTGLEATWVRATMENRGTPVSLVSWGEARLREVGSARPYITPTAAPTPPEGDIPFTFTFVGDAHFWHEEIYINTDRANFLIRDGQLLYAHENQRMLPFPNSERDTETLTLPDIPDLAFVTQLRGGAPVVSTPETVWPVLRFTLAALESASSGTVALKIG